MSGRTGGAQRDDLEDFGRRPRHPVLLAGYGVVILLIVAGFLVQLAQGHCPVP